MNCEHMFRLKLAIMKSIPDISNSRYPECNTFKCPNYLILCLIQNNMFVLSVQFKNVCTFGQICSNVTHVAVCSQI
jgi:hypothetical protein